MMYQPFLFFSSSFLPVTNEVFFYIGWLYGVTLGGDGKDTVLRDVWILFRPVVVDSSL